MPDSWKRLFERAGEHGVTLDAIQDALAEQRTNEEHHDG
jgi:hypothetical protein